MKNWIKFKCRECGEKWTCYCGKGMTGPCPECDLPNTAVSWNLIDLTDEQFLEVLCKNNA
jgi:hypothetical protein